MIYGPAQSDDFLIPALLRDLLRGQRFSLSEGSQTRDLLFIDDFVDAVCKAGTNPGLEGSILNISSGVEHRIRDIALMIARMLGAEDRLDIGALLPREAEMERFVARNDLARQKLGWEPKVQLHEGLTRTIDWYRTRAGR
jgi:nucleoside-diphosphate-sugar epimerase